MDDAYPLIDLRRAEEEIKNLEGSTGVYPNLLSARSVPIVPHFQVGSYESSGGLRDHVG